MLKGVVTQTDGADAADAAGAGAVVYYFLEALPTLPNPMTTAAVLSVMLDLFWTLEHLSAVGGSSSSSSSMPSKQQHF